MRSLVWIAVLCVASTGAISVAEPWWFDFEFDDPNDLPQGEGWVRMALVPTKQECEEAAAVLDRIL